MSPDVEVVETTVFVVTRWDRYEEQTETIAVFSTHELADKLAYDVRGEVEAFVLDRVTKERT